MLLLFAWAHADAGFAAEPRVFRSQSGQFLVRGLPLDLTPSAYNPTSAVSHVRLDPSLLTVSAERIKQALLRELGLRDQWRGAIYVSLHPVREADEPIHITSVRYNDGWAYQVEVPERVEGARLIRAFVEVLLAEITNRRHGPHPAELPPWLAEGLTAHLLATASSTLMLEPSMRIAREEPTYDPLREARRRLQTRPPLTLDELNWPDERTWTGNNAEVYRNSAHLFVFELMRLKNGRRCLREMLPLLAEHWNWQTAFLRAFQPHFQRLLDVDKWWTLNIVHFTGRDLRLLWTREETARQLETILQAPVNVRLDAKDLPVTGQASLQSVIANWEYRRQVPGVRQTLNRLVALRLRAAQDLVGLVDDYRQALEVYLAKREQAMTGASGRNKAPANLRVVVQDAIKRLDELDRRRTELLAQDRSDAALAAREAQRRSELSR